jgi:hypothetical protein
VTSIRTFDSFIQDIILLLKRKKKMASRHFDFNLRKIGEVESARKKTTKKQQQKTETKKSFKSKLFTKENVRYCHS